MSVSTSYYALKQHTYTALLFVARFGVFLTWGSVGGTGDGVLETGTGLSCLSSSGGLMSGDSSEITFL